MDRSAEYDTEWLLRAYRGEIDTDAGANAAAVARATPDLLARWPAAVEALAEGDRRRLGDDRRFAPVEFGPPPVDVDAAATEAFDRLVGDNGDRQGQGEGQGHVAPAPGRTHR